MGDLVRGARLYLGTADGLIALDLRDGGLIARHGRTVEGQAVRGIATHPDDPDLLFIACGLRGWGLHLSNDGGRTSDEIGFADRWVWDVVVDPVDPASILVGTEPPGLFRGRFDGSGWRFEEFTGVHDLPSRSRWTFFHDPFRAGHVHGIAVTAKRPGRIVAGVEHGALILTNDGGVTWRERLVGADLHRVVIHPQEPDTMLAGAGDGLYVSRDGGDSWAPNPGLRGKYIHGVVLDPEEPGTIYVYIDSRDCPLYRTRNSGERWDPIGEGLAPARPADPIRLHPRARRTLFYAADTEAGRSRLYQSSDGGDTWSAVLDDLPKVWRMQIVSLA